MTALLHDLIAEQAYQHLDRPALTSGTTTLSYGEMWSVIQAASEGLRGIGLARGDRVGIYLDKRVESVAAMFATSAAGGVFVPINPLLRSRQVRYILNDCSVRILVTTADRLAALELGVDHGTHQLDHIVVVPDGVTPGPPADQLSSAPGGKGAAKVISWALLTTLSGPGAPVARGVDVDMAAIFYTSGSTGDPKGVVLSHRNMIVGAESVSDYLVNRPDDVILAALPLSFDAGFSQLSTAFRVGAHVVLHNYLLPGEVIRLCERHGVTGLTCVPPLWIQLAERDWPAAVGARLRYFANTGGRLPKQTLDRLRRCFPNARPYLMYGLTEAFRSTYLDPAEIDRRPDSIGRAIPNAEILVVRPDGTPCLPGEHGELVHRGALVALGYWNDPDRTRSRFRPAPGLCQPWRCTPDMAVWSGDIVFADEEGYLYFVGRNDDMIKTSGYRVSPTEIEEAAYDTGMVRDAVALGLPDERLGQHVALVVTGPVEVGAGCSLDEHRLIRELRHRLPLYMVPKTIVVRAEVPRSPNGKFDRQRIREELTR
ncbi:MAG: acyl-CoA ligase (AMP-forming), exosortase A system-associated [Acidimicrobiales bacterium]